VTFPVVFLVGPTAAGKSRLALALARKWNAEIVSADSMQVYRGLNIGTAKPAASEQQQVPHHLIDILNPSESFSVAEYRRRALEVIYDLKKRKKLAFVVGGTGLYIRALLEGLSAQPAGCESVRKKLEQEAADRGIEALYQDLLEIDPESAKRIRPGDQRRIFRALEIYRLSGKPAAVWHRTKEPLRSLGFEPVVIGIFRERSWLYETIDQRVEVMIANGLEQEVRTLMAAGPLSKTALQAVGYKEFFSFIDQGKENPEPREVETVKILVQQHSRNLAKRQMTWFRRELGIKWIEWTRNDHENDVIQRLDALLTSAIKFP